MKWQIPDGLRSASAWLIFPVIPALLGQTYHQTLNFGLGGGPDPRDWDWPAWVIMLGPLIGFGYLAGATATLPEKVEARRLRRWLGRRWVLVAVGPWIGFLTSVAIAFAVSWSFTAVEMVFPNLNWTMPSFLSNGGEKSWAGWLLIRGVILAIVAWVGYAWLILAWLIHRRARGLGCLLRCFYRGFGAALFFVGSLFGTFWTITEVWRDHFFDRRIVPILLVVCGLMLMSGCASNLTYGEVRRRELFQALLLAWLIGLAIAWRWWARVRSKPPGSHEG